MQYISMDIPVRITQGDKQEIVVSQMTLEVCCTPCSETMNHFCSIINELHISLLLQEKAVVGTLMLSLG